MSASNKKRVPIDWSAARARLEKVRESTGRAGHPTPQQIEATYRRRAALLSQPALAVNESSAAEEILIFRIGRERFGVPLTKVSEILSNPPCAPVPGAPPEIAGVMQVRGELRPVWELSRVLGLPAEAQAGSNLVLLLRGAAREVGARIDSAEDIRAMPPGERRAAPEALARRALWITPDMIPILDMDFLFEGIAR